MDINGALVEAKYVHSVSQVRIVASASVPFRPATVKMPLALIDTKQITVWLIVMLFK